MPKHSFRCFECRRRKVKCDERPKGCLRCELYGVRCPGYPDRFDVVLRQRQSASEKLIKTMRSNHNQERDPKPSDGPKSILPLVQALPVDVDQATLGAYYTSYCVSSATIVPLEHLRSRGNGCLWAAIRILGVMQLNHTWQISDSRLSTYYAQAASLLNNALADVSESREDHTMLATLTLSVVEMKQSPDFTMDYWIAHTNGAAALMELRGVKQIASRIGAAMFMQASSQIVTECVLRQRRIPDKLLKVRQQLQEFVISENHPLWSWHGLMYRFVNFWADVIVTISKSILDVENARSLIRSALKMRQDMDLIFKSAAPRWDFRVRPGNTFRPLVDHEHIYPSLLAARVWNDRRAATILLYTAVARAVELCPAVDNVQIWDSLSTPQDLKTYIDEEIQHTTKDILAAIPQPLSGLKKKRRGPPIALPSYDLAEANQDLDTQGLRLCGTPSEYDEDIFMPQK